MKSSTARSSTRRLSRRCVETKLLKILEEQRLTPHVADWLAGDDLSPRQYLIIERLKTKYGQALYSELVFILTQLTMAPERAEALWHQLVEHRKTLSQAVRRPVSMTLTCLDFFESLGGPLKDPVLMPYKQLEATAELATRDALTQLYDRSVFVNKLKTELLRYSRYDTPCSVLILDVDDFKAINDNYGHPFGDQVLRDLAAVLDAEVRDLDTVARYGGEEFVVLSPHSNTETAFRIGERLRTCIADRVGAKMNPAITVTVSIGVANCPADAVRAEALLKRADDALYKAKELGKNRVHKHQRRRNLLKPDSMRL